MINMVSETESIASALLDLRDFFENDNIGILLQTALPLVTSLIIAFFEKNNNHGYALFLKKNTLRIPNLKIYRL